MPLPDWTVPFSLTSAVYSGTPLAINTPVVFTSGTGTYFLRADGCSLNNQVRQTKDFVPQADGAILHCRFLAGMEMTLAIQMWESTDNVACDTLLQEMIDELMGYLYGLLNAGDNEGRISWIPEGGSSVTSTQRMLDDIRLLSYPTESQQTAAYEITVTVDCALPYAEDLTQQSIALSGTPVVITNYGNRPSYPVWKINAGTFTLANATTGESFSFDDTLPGCPNVGAGYAEIDTFRNTIYLNGSGANLKPGVVMTTSDFFSIVPGANTITLSSGTGTCLLNSAWA